MTLSSPYASRTEHRGSNRTVTIYQWRHQFRTRGLLPAPAGRTVLPVDIGAPMQNAEPALEDKIVSSVIV